MLYIDRVRVVFKKVLKCTAEREDPVDDFVACFTCGKARIVQLQLKVIDNIAVPAKRVDMCAREKLINCGVRQPEYAPTFGKYM